MSAGSVAGASHTERTEDGEADRDTAGEDGEIVGFEHYSGRWGKLVGYWI